MAVGGTHGAGVGCWRWCRCGSPQHHTTLDAPHTTPQHTESKLYTQTLQPATTHRPNHHHRHHHRRHHHHHHHHHHHNDNSETHRCTTCGCLKLASMPASRVMLDDSSAARSSFLTATSMSSNLPRYTDPKPPLPIRARGSTLRRSKGITHSCRTAARLSPPPLGVVVLPAAAAAAAAAAPPPPPPPPPPPRPPAPGLLLPPPPELLLYAPPRSPPPLSPPPLSPPSLSTPDKRCSNNSSPLS